MICLYAGARFKQKNKNYRSEMFEKFPSKMFSIACNQIVDKLKISML